MPSSSSSELLPPLETITPYNRGPAITLVAFVFFFVTLIIVAVKFGTALCTKTVLLSTDAPLWIALVENPFCPPRARLIVSMARLLPLFKLYLLNLQLTMGLGNMHLLFPLLTSPRTTRLAIFPPVTGMDPKAYLFAASISSPMPLNYFLFLSFHFQSCPLVD